MAWAVTWIGSDDASRAPLGCGFKVAVGALDIAFGEGVPGRTIQAHGPAGRGHAAIDHAGGAIQRQHLVGGCVNGAVAPGFAFAVAVSHISPLCDGSIPLPGWKDASSTSLVLTRSGWPGVCDTMRAFGAPWTCSQLSQVVKAQPETCQPSPVSAARCRWSAAGRSGRRRRYRRAADGGRPRPRKSIAER